MPVESGYTVKHVILNRHEPLGETAARLLELAEEKGYSPRVVEAQRGEHDAELSYRVPEDVAEAFDAERAERWPDKIENDEETPSDEGAVSGDAYAADDARRTRAVREVNTAKAAEDTPASESTPASKSRSAK